MTLMYVYKGEGSGLELRMSLRSVAAHLKNVDRVAVVGSGFPSWLSRDVIRIAVDSPFRRKQMNILRAVLEGLRRLDCGPCLYSSDDHIFTGDFDARFFPFFSNGLARTYEWYAARKKRITPYRGSLAETHVLLERHGYPCGSKMSGHFNTHMNSDDVDEIETLAGAYWDTEYGYEPSELFVAAALRKDPAITLVPRYDAKIHLPSTVKRIEEETAKGGGMFSTSDEAMESGDLPGWLFRRFPVRSPWESGS